MTCFELTPSEQARWEKACADFRVNIRRPSPDETMLSDSEIWHGIRYGVFGADDLDFECDKK